MKDWIDNENKVCAQNYYPLPFVLSKGEGVWLWDMEGNRYLDMMTAYSAVSLGHCHPRMIKVLNEQARTLCVTSRAFHTNTLCPFLEKLCAISGMDMALPMNTGTEAVETALKAARRWGYRYKKIPEDKAKIIVARDNFHGRSITIISFSSHDQSKKEFGPFTPGFIEIPFGDSEALRHAITPETCAFLVEPIQGEAGIQMPREGYLKACSQICKENNVLLILDEVQSGLGRTGQWFAYEHEKIKPDGLILGKALGGGILPVSVFLSRQDVMGVFEPGSHGSTFGGNPLAARIGLEVLNILEQEHLIERSKALGEMLLQGLKKIKHPFIREVRGKGLWVGVEIDPLQMTGRKICEAYAKNGVLTKEVHQKVLRFAPPFVIKPEEIQFAIDQFANTLNSLG